MREDKQTSTPDGAGAYERDRDTTEPDRPDPSEYRNDDVLPSRTMRPMDPAVRTIQDPFGPNMNADDYVRLIRLTIGQMRVDDNAAVKLAHADELANYFTDLDNYLANGGRPPRVWTVNR